MISIIVPSYNVEKYIDRCIDSLVKQTYRNIEIIVVVDGAIDGTYDKAIAWQNRDDRITVVYQDNSGSGPARNNGLSLAKGEYIIFVDPDDWVDEEMVESLYNDIKKKNVDLVTSGCIIEFFDSEKWISSVEELFPEFYSTNKDEIHKEYFRFFNMGALSAPTKKIFKKSIIDSKDIRFPALRRSQDIVFNYRYFNHITSIFVSNKAYYHYRVDDLENQTKVQYTYYKSISYIYNDLKNLCANWGGCIDDVEYQKFCLHFFDALILVLKLNNKRNYVSEIIQDTSIQELVKDTKMPNTKMRILKFLIMTRCGTLVFLCMKLYLLIENEKRNKYAN